MDTIKICDLEVHFHVGVPDEERATAQRLLITIELGTDFARCVAADDLTHTIDYFALKNRVVAFGAGRSWKLIEKLASDLAEMVLRESRPNCVSIEVKKFIMPETRYVSVRLTRDHQATSGS